MRDETMFGVMCGVCAVGAFAAIVGVALYYEPSRLASLTHDGACYRGRYYTSYHTANNKSFVCTAFIPYASK